MERGKNSDYKIGGNLWKEHWEVLGTLPFSIIFQSDNGGSIWLMSVFSQFNSFGLMLYSPAQEKACPSSGTWTQPLCHQQHKSHCQPSLTTCPLDWCQHSWFPGSVLQAAFCPFSAHLSASQHLFPHLTLLSHLGQGKLVLISAGPSAQRKHLSLNSFETRPPRSAFQSVFLIKLWRKNI